MPSFMKYKQHNASLTNGEAIKRQSDMVMENTWYNDIQSKKAYIYDYYHDDEPLKYMGLSPEHSKTKTPIDIKFIINAYNSESKDVVGKHIQFKPSFNWRNEYSLSYYKDCFEDKYSSEFPIGMYLDIPDEKGIYRKWLVTEIANTYDLQFPTWYILPIDHIFQWVHEGIKYQMCGVSRSQNSYNSGKWVDNIFTSTENQRKCCLPMNDISSTLFYDKRIVLSAPIKEPITWSVTKVEQTSPKGISRLTFAQGYWDEHKDVFEYEEIEIDGTINRFTSSVYYSDKKIIGMWASYNDSSIVPMDKDDSKPITDYSVVTYSGIKPEINTGGSYKKFTVNFYNQDNELIDFKEGTWSFSIDGEDADDKIAILTHDESSDVEENQIKVKVNKNNNLIKKILVVSYESDNGIKSNVEMEIRGL